MTYQVAIVGGGISGLSLSIDLRRRGYSVIVIEKGNYPRHKVCGEYISMESDNYLKSLCPAIASLELPIITKFKLSSTSAREFQTSLTLGGFGISRFLLEDLLFKEATKIGVVFMLDKKAGEIRFDADKGSYTILAGSEPVKAMLVCNASGRKSNFEAGGQSKRDINYVGVKYHVKLKRPAELIEIHNFPGGYCGISNIEEGKSCLCYLVNSEKLKSSGNSILSMERKFLFANKNIRRIFETAEFVLEKPVTVSGVNFRIKKSADDQVFYLGDASGSIAPVTGNGMSMGLRSAHVLAETIDQYFSQAITREQLTSTYSRFWKSEFSTRIKLSRYFQKLSEYPGLTKATIGLFNASPRLAGMVIQKTHGKPF